MEHALVNLNLPMAIHVLLLAVPLLASLTVAAVIDVRQRRIPNALVIVLLLTGVGQALIYSGPPSIGQAVGGMAIGFVVGTVLFALRALGGGDVKLLAAVGVWLGPMLLLTVIALSALLAMLLTLADALRRRSLRQLFSNTLAMLLDMLNRRSLAVADADQPSTQWRSGGRPLPFAVPLSLATALALFIAGALSKGAV